MGVCWYVCVCVACVLVTCTCMCCGREHFSVYMYVCVMCVAGEGMYRVWRIQPHCIHTDGDSAGERSCGGTDQ